MPDLVQSFVPSIPAGTAIASPVTVPMNIPSRIVNKIRVRIPPGPSGQMGFQIGSSGQQIIPENTGAFLVADDEIFEWDVTDFPQGGSYQLIGYNLGIYAHSVYVTFVLAPLDQPSNPPATALPAAVLSSAPSVVVTGDVNAPTIPTGPGGTQGAVASPLAPPTVPTIVPPSPPPTTLGGVTGGPVVQPPTIPEGPSF